MANLLRLRLWLIKRLVRYDIQVIANTSFHNGKWFVSEMPLLLTGKVTLIGNEIRTETPEMDEVMCEWLDRVQK